MDAQTGELRGGMVVKRHRLATRIWHWVNALAVIVMLMSGLMIFNAHPQLYWGKAGANADPAWLQIGAVGGRGRLEVAGITIDTTGVLGRWTDRNGQVRNLAFPGWATIPTDYSLSAARRWHLFFAWVLGIGLLAHWLLSALNRHWRTLTLRRAELRPRHLWQEVKDHARLRFPTGAAARGYNTLQKLSYLGVLLVVLPVLVLTGLAMSPALNVAWPWLLDLFGGRQSARSIHFIAAFAMTAFILVHLTLVLLAGPWNETRSMITGKFRLPKERAR